ncbi:MAG: PLP-dependent aminotransferase family protein [Acidimicrobiia bacterium]|nr:PLP-dependent aminotransferase family protein [Acidimicrobiia bacterium]
MAELLLDLDPSLGRRAGLERALRQAIGEGRLVAGASLPSSRTLARDLDVSRATVVAAYEQLGTEGYLVARRGAGTRVADLRAVEEDASVEHGLSRSYRYDFRPGSPDVSLFPRATWLRSLRRVVGESTDRLFEYGDPRGLPELRRVLADHLGRTRAVSARPDTVRVYGGFFAAIGFVAEALGRAGVVRIAVEDPSLFVVREVLELAGLDVVAVPVDDGGIDVGALVGLDVGAVLVTPANQYPLGVTMVPERRMALLSWARRHDAWIIEDDYDGEFRYDRQPVGALQGLAPDRVVYAGTASKTLAPGLRLSWLVVPSALEVVLSAVTHIRSGVSSIEQAALADFIGNGELDRHVRAVRKVYGRRRAELIARLADDVPWCRLGEVPSAGLHLTVLLDTRSGIAAGATAGERRREGELIANAAASSIGLLGLRSHWVGPNETEGLVIGYTRPAQHRFPVALDRLIGHLRTAG